MRARVCALCARLEERSVLFKGGTEGVGIPSKGSGKKIQNYHEIELI